MFLWGGGGQALILPLMYTEHYGYFIFDSNSSPNFNFLKDL